MISPTGLGLVEIAPQGKAPEGLVGLGYSNKKSLESA